MYLSLILLFLHLWGNVSLSQNACSKLPDVPNAKLIEWSRKDEYEQGDVIYFTCEPGYISSRPFGFICRRRNWLALGPGTCYSAAIKCRLTLPPLEGTTYEPAYRNVFTPDETLRVTCGENYWISTPREASAVITCQHDGQWTINPICKEVTCRRPYDRSIYYWNTSLGQKITLGDTVTYSCISGYKSPDGANRATCTRGGWSPDPLCQEITCKPRFYRNADIVDRKTIYKYKEQAEYNCRGAYVGGFTLTCTEHGWTGSQQCTEITCDRRDIPNATVKNIKEKYKYNERAYYVCNEGYRGLFILTCSERGWAGRPQCTAKLCRKLDIEDAYITTNDKESYNNNEQVQYACRNKTEKQFNVTCERGVWAGIQNCSELADCEMPPFVADGDIKYFLKSLYSHNERVEYMCQTYYTMEGEPYKTCVNGEWTGQMRCLKPCIVNEDDFRQHNITLKSSNKRYLVHDEAIEFRCARGSPVGTVALRQRCNGGVIPLPTCS